MVLRPFIAVKFIFKKKNKNKKKQAEIVLQKMRMYKLPKFRCANHRICDANRICHSTTLLIQQVEKRLLSHSTIIEPGVTDL